MCLMTSADAIDLVDYQLRISLDPELSDSQSVRSFEPSDEGFILCGVIGGLEQDAEDIPDFLPSRGSDNDASPSDSLPCGSIEGHLPWGLCELNWIGLGVTPRAN